MSLELTAYICDGCFDYLNRIKYQKEKDREEDYGGEEERWESD